MKKKLFKRLLVLSFLLITFFSIRVRPNAASFAYSDFNWEEFSKQNNTLWVSACDSDPSEDCEDRFLATTKRFYVRLYSLLDQVQKKYGFIDDNIIIETVFFGLNYSSFKDPEEDNEFNPYKLDDDENSATRDKFIGNAGGENDNARSYFENETDSLKTLINNFIGYRSTCYGVASEKPQTYTDSQGNSYKACATSTYTVYGDKCVANLETYNGTFFDSLGLSFLGSENELKCDEKIKELGYTDKIFETSATQEVNEKFFWDFLENSDYLDKKEHLQDYYISVLGKVKKERMTELTYEEKLEHKDNIIKVRKRIIRNIQSKIEKYKGLSEKFNTASQSQYWWPIGSQETNDVDGKLMATGAPDKTTVSSPYGLRTHPVTGVVNSKHSGIDIPGDLGQTNVIASKDGVVVFSTKANNINCADGGDGSCGGGYGNYIIIQHVDGNYTLYAHLASGSTTVEMGESVKQGQVIAKVGNSGRSTGAHLHFEIRVGGNDSSATQDPLNFVSADNPRPSGASNQLLEWIGVMEGTGPMEGDYYKVYNDSGGVATVGHGITLKYNADAFKAHGINPDTLSVGSLVPKAIVDAIYQEDVQGRLDNIRGMLSTQGVVLNDNQIAALASLQFNCGNINGFFEAYSQYKSSDALCTNWWENKALHDANGNYLEGLKKRRIAECDLFVNGNYNMNVYG